ncbi:hypothetical protein IGI44_000121 [Enterococcus sp. DIV0756]
MGEAFNLHSTILDFDFDPRNRLLVCILFTFHYFRF